MNTAEEYLRKESPRGKQDVVSMHDDWHMDLKSLCQYMEDYHKYATQQGEKVPDLSKLDKPSKDEFIIDFIQMTAKNVLSVFVALGLKTHIEAKVVNDADGNEYELIFRKSPSEVDQQKEVGDEEIKTAASEYEKIACCDSDHPFLKEYVNEDFVAGAKWTQSQLTQK